jgi:isocitrate dehydrogenase kinase/phosphatase
MDAHDSKQTGLARTIAETILQGFDRHFHDFQEITVGARERFESSDWDAEYRASRQRIMLYDIRVNDTIETLRKVFDFGDFDAGLWREIKIRYIELLREHRQPELAETFYTSTFCRQFHRRYFTNDYIFVRSVISTEYLESDRPSYHVYYPAKHGLRETIRRILSACDFRSGYENMDEDVRNITKALCRHFVDKPRRAGLNFQLQVINSLFFRNKAAYIVGKAINNHQVFPFALPILKNERGELYVDALLLGKTALSQLFEFSFVYFMVEHPVPSAIVSFLKEIMPDRSKSELYSAIGYHKQGKTDFYRDFLHHIRYSDDDLIPAPGIRGLVMAVFTLPSYPYVFKVIRDVFAAPKDIDRKTVENKYQLVKQHDRVGRMADMLEYSDVAFPRWRFNNELLEELMSSCASSMTFEEDWIVVKHVYIERRMTPLNIELAEADDQRLEKLIKGYGNAVKELAAVNIFPGDMLFKNFGVTPLGRVVFYDYDEISYLTDCRFRKIPPPRHPEDELAAEPWYGVAPNDVFPEEFETFLLADERIRRAFMKYHADLLQPEYWQQKQENIRRGVHEHVFPYPRRLRFRQRPETDAATAARS